MSLMIMKALKLSGFAVVAMLVVFGAELSQAVAEGFLLGEEQQMHSLVNQARADRGLATLDGNDPLKTIARRQAQAMSAAGYIYHTTDLAQQAKSLSINYSLLGENVGVGPSVDAVQRAFLASPLHLENIVDPTFNALGVGAVTGGNGILYFSQNFAALRASAPRPAAPAPAPTAAAPAPAAPAAPAVGGSATPTAVNSGREPAPATAAPPPPPTPAPVDTRAAAIQGSLDRFPEMAGEAVGARGVFALRPGESLERAAGGQPVSMPATIVSMLGAFASKLVFWR